VLQDTLKSNPAENKVMKRASLLGVSTTTMFYVLCGCVGYAAFGNNAPGNFLTGFGFYEPFWLIDFANICIAIHLIGAYQVNLFIYAFIFSELGKKKIILIFL
jgi:amino acid permease